MRLSSLVAAALFFQLIITGCKKPTSQPQPVIDLSTVKITAFQFSETANTSINITHPVISNGTEVEQGRIDIVIPYGTTGLQLTPLVSNYEKQGFTISPQLGIKTDYLNKEVLYTISSTQNTQKKVHYKVVVQQAEPGPLQLTNVRFLKTKNAQLNADVTAAHVVHSNSSIGKIYVFVPEGTDFHTLTASLEHNGEQAVFTQNAADVPANSTTFYPENGQQLDLAYPKGFYVAVKRGNETVTYSIVVDVAKPIVFTQEFVTLDLATGVNHHLKAGEIINRGNRPLTITQIVHSDPSPANSPLRTFALIPSGGLLPGAKADVMTSFDASFLAAGTYEITARMRPNFVLENEVQTFLQPSNFQLKVRLQ